VTDGADQYRIDQLVRERDELQKEIDEKKALVARVVQRSPGRKNWYMLCGDSAAAMEIRRWIDGSRKS
jgi:hypothetical protein